MSIGGNVVRTTNDLDENLVLKMFRQGKTSCKIAKELHVHPYKIAAILNKNNIIYGINKQRTDKLTESMVIDLYLKGYSTIDIGKKFNINKATVRRILSRNNIKLRTFKETKNLKRNLSTLQ